MHCYQRRRQVRDHSSAAATWTQTFGFSRKGVSIRSMAIQALCEAVEFRIQAAVHRNSAEFTSTKHATLVAALNSSNSTTLFKAYNEFKPWVKRRSKRLVGNDGTVPAHDREEKGHHT